MKKGTRFVHGSGK